MGSRDLAVVGAVLLLRWGFPGVSAPPRRALRSILVLSRDRPAPPVAQCRVLGHRSRRLAL